MQLETTCASCSSAVRIRERAKDRMVLTRQVGKTFEVRCTACGARQTVHVDEVVAVGQPGWSMLVVALLVGMMFTTFMWQRGWITTLSLILIGGIYYALRFEESKRITAFNHFTLRG